MDSIERATAEAVVYLMGSGCPFPAGAKASIVAANWAVAFADMTPTDLRTAAGMHVQSERAQFWPTPFELRSYVAPPAEDWGALFADVMRRLGKIDSLDASDEVKLMIMRWIKAQGGSNLMGQWQTADLPHRKREFIDHMTKAARDAEIAARRERVVGGGLKLIGGGS